MFPETRRLGGTPPPIGDHETSTGGYSVVPGSPQSAPQGDGRPPSDVSNPSAARTIDVHSAHATERQTPPSGGSEAKMPPSYLRSMQHR